MTPPTVCGHPPNLSLLSLNKLSPPSSLPRPPRCLTPYPGRTFSPSTSSLSTSRPLILDMEIEIEAEDNGISAARSQELTLEDEALPEGGRDGQIVKPTHRAVPINLRMSSISPNSPEFPYPPYSPISPTDATSPSSATFQPLVPPRAHPIFPISPNPRFIPLSPSAKHYLLTRRAPSGADLYTPLPLLPPRIRQYRGKKRWNGTRKESPDLSQTAFHGARTDIPRSRGKCPLAQDAKDAKDGTGDELVDAGDEDGNAADGEESRRGSLMSGPPPRVYTVSVADGSEL